MSTHYIRAPGVRDHLLIMPSSTARDARLSYRARGILARLLTNSDGFYSTSESLRDQGTEGREAVRTALRELRAAGYVVKHGIQGKSGKWTGTEMLVYDSPILPSARKRNRSQQAKPVKPIK